VSIDIGLVSQTGLRFSQVYKRALERKKKITGVHLETIQWH